MKTDPKTLKEYVSLLFFLLKEINCFSKNFLPLSAIITVINTITPFIFAILPTLLIDELTSGQDMRFIVLYVAFLIIGGCVASILTSWLSTYVGMQSEKINKLFDLKVGLAMAETDYSNLENTKYLNMYQTYKDASNRSSSITYVFTNAFDTLSYCLVLLGYIVIMINLMFTDGATVPSGIEIIDFIASNTYIWIMLMAIACIGSVLLQTKANNAFQKYQNDFAPTQRAYRYYQSLSKDYKNGKDVRLFEFYPLLSRRIDEYLMESNILLKKLAKSELKFSAPASMISKFQMIFIYALVSVKVISKKITYGQFYLYFTVFSNVFNTISNILSNIASIKYALGYYYTYKTITETSKNLQKQPTQPIPCSIESIEFVNVSFKYPGSEIYVLYNFSCKIDCNQRISIVGLNGAGKTTFTKLLQRLYVPDDGVILINGVDIQSFKFEEYIKMFSTVFQDVSNWAYSIGENVSCSSEYDDILAKKALSDVDLWQIAENRNGLETLLTRYFSKDGVVLSGGETQKLAIARALYKNAPIFIFDEPTAALDPLAEMEIMEQFDSLTNGKTTLFISHRLSSCRFSDRIFVIHEGRLLESGTHSELIKNNKKYNDLWCAQAQYYLNYQNNKKVLN